MSMGNFGHSTVFFATRGLGVQYGLPDQQRDRPAAGGPAQFPPPQLAAAVAGDGEAHRAGRARAGRAAPVQGRGRGAARRPISPTASTWIARARWPRRPPRTRGSTTAGAPVVLTIGRIHPQKNLEGLIDAAALAMTQRPLRLMIVGSGDPARVAALASARQDARDRRGGAVRGRDRQCLRLAQRAPTCSRSPRTGKARRPPCSKRSASACRWSRRARPATRASCSTTARYGALADAEDPAEHRRRDPQTAR